VNILLNRLFHVEPGEWTKLLQFGLFGLMLQIGLGIGFSAGDAAFLTHVGADKLAVVFLLTPVVMVAYTLIFAYLLVRYSINHVIDITLAMLIGGGILFWLLLGAKLPLFWQTTVYYGLKLYLGMWYIALYSLFWNFTDTYFNIQDGKRLFPLFAACCALGTTLGALIVSQFADVIPLRGFMLIWAAIALATVPVARSLRRRWQSIADSDTDLDDQIGDVRLQLTQVIDAFKTSSYTLRLAIGLFVMLLLTNLAEFQYSAVLQVGRSEAELAALLGKLYAASHIFNVFICLFVFNRLVGRIGVRNVSLILPLTYFTVFGYFFLAGGAGAALAAFFAYHGVLTSIEYNNQNLLFNAVPSAVKRPLRTILEGFCEPLASLVAGGFLVFAATRTDMRELSGIGVILCLLLIAIVIAIRHQYPVAMAANMRRGWLNFSDRRALVTAADAEELPAHCEQSIAELLDQLTHRDATLRKTALTALHATVMPGDIAIVPRLIAATGDLERHERESIITLLGIIGDVAAIPDILILASTLSPRERRQTASMLISMGETAIPGLTSFLADYALPVRARSIAARALVSLSQAQFASQFERLVRDELHGAHRLINTAAQFDSQRARSPAIGLLARLHRERIDGSVDFALELLALGGTLPDFDLLIVSLHSANTKVRGNAIEAIENGVNHAIFRLLAPLINRRSEVSRIEHNEEDFIDLVTNALTSGNDWETALAAQALADCLPHRALARHLRAVLKPDVTPMVRELVATLLKLDAITAPTIVDRVNALRTIPGFAYASMDALVALAGRLQITDQAQMPGMRFEVGDTTFGLDNRDVREVATRYADLALTMLKAQDNRSYAG
jgi:AAA family ATP:ADP antiporter